MHQGSKAYFVELDTGGQDVMHIFATPEQVHKLTELFDIKHQGY
jgi:ABC-type transporter Mla MlaB component